MLSAMAAAIFLVVISQRVAADAAESDSLRAEVKSVSRRIDAFIDKRLRAAGVKPAAQAGDARFLRRVSLDLTGRIPNMLDVRDFLDPTNHEADKRWTCVKQMLGRREYADHFASVWRATFLPAISENLRTWDLVPSFQDWIHKHLRKNSRYDHIVRELLTAPPYSGPDDWDDRMTFYFANENRAENVAGTTAQLFLGIQLECAQCHDHPLTKWTRSQFWGFAAFFDGTMRKVDGLRPGSADNKAGRQITIPGTATVVKAKFPSAEEPRWENSDDSRKILANWLTAKDNPFFAKATVDLVWKYFFDVSLLHPDDGKPIAHPELLDELARQFVSHGYDLKFLIRAIVHTQAYQRSSDVAGGRSPADVQMFARMPVRALSPEQVFCSFAEATDYTLKVAPHEYNRRTPRKMFLDKFGSEDQRSGQAASTFRALLATKASFFAKRTELHTQMTMKKLAELGEEQRNGKAVDVNAFLHSITLIERTSTAQKVEVLYVVVLSRLPTPEESRRTVRYIDSGGRACNPRQAIAEVYRNLLNSDEFLLNQ